MGVLRSVFLFSLEILARLTPWLSVIFLLLLSFILEPSVFLLLFHVTDVLEESRPVCFSCPAQVGLSLEACIG